jgi:hypothetical protein
VTTCLSDVGNLGNLGSVGNVGSGNVANLNNRNQVGNVGLLHSFSMSWRDFSSRLPTSVKLHARVANNMPEEEIGWILINFSNGFNSAVQ